MRIVGVNRKTNGIEAGEITVVIKEGTHDDYLDLCKLGRTNSQVTVSAKPEPLVTFEPGDRVRTKYKHHKGGVGTVVQAPDGVDLGPNAVWWVSDNETTNEREIGYDYAKSLEKIK